MTISTPLHVSCWAFFLNAGFTVIEFIGGWLTNNTAIMADAVHDLGDRVSIGLAWLLNKISNMQANDTYSAAMDTKDFRYWVR